MNSHSKYLENNLDFWEMRDLLIDYELNGKYTCYSAGMLEHWRYRLHSIKLLEDPDFLSGLAELWRDENGRLTGLALSENAKNDIFVLSRLGQEYIERDIYKWIDAVWSRGMKKVQTICEAGDEVKESLLTEFGYSRKRVSGHVYKYDLNMVRLDHKLDEGYVVQDITVDRNFRVRAKTISSAFHPSCIFKQHGR